MLLELTELELGTLLDVLEDARNQQGYSDMSYINGLSARLTVLWDAEMTRLGYQTRDMVWTPVTVSQATYRAFPRADRHGFLKGKGVKE